MKNRGLFLTVLKVCDRVPAWLGTGMTLVQAVDCLLVSLQHGRKKAKELSERRRKVSTRALIPFMEAPIA